MNAYIFAAAFHCDDCGRAIRERLTAEGKAPADPSNEYSYDSDYFPKGPYDNGGGESDCPEHCDSCGLYLENDLTSHGVEYVLEELREALRTGEVNEVEQLWALALIDYCLDARDKDVVNAYIDRFGLKRGDYYRLAVIPFLKYPTSNTEGQL